MDALLRRRQMMLAGGSPIPPAPLPYTPVEYLENDGVAYIDTGIKGADPKSSELKVIVPNDYSNGPTLLGSKGGSARFFLAAMTSGGSMAFAHYYNYSTGDGMPLITTSINNGTPVIVKTKMKKGAQTISIKEQGDADFTSASKAQNTAVSTGQNMFLFAVNIDGSPSSVKFPSGCRLYYCKIYSDFDFSTLVFNGIPCYYNGEYGLWDTVSNSFFGNVAGSGAFTGPSIS